MSRRVHVTAARVPLMLDADYFRNHRGVAHPGWIWVGGAALDLHERLTRTTVQIERFDLLPREPVLLVTNASHMYDIFPFRCAMRRAGVPVVSIAKGKYFQSRSMAWAMGQVGALPIVSRGHHVHLYPEGTVSSRLGTGRRGALQLAHALGLAVQPVGISGCREAFAGPRRVRMRGGRIQIRFGAPWRHATASLPSSYRPFDVMHERDCGPLLDEATGTLMNRIDDLLEPSYRRSATHIHDGTTGVGRFL